MFSDRFSISFIVPSFHTLRETAFLLYPSIAAGLQSLRKQETFLLMVFGISGVQLPSFCLLQDEVIFLFMLGEFHITVFIDVDVYIDVGFLAASAPSVSMDVPLNLTPSSLKL